MNEPEGSLYMYMGERMEQKFIMTAFGEDRPGFVADVTELLYEHDCNLEDSTMTRLSDEFAMIVLFSGRGEELEVQLSRACRRLEREKGISAFFRSVEMHQGQFKKKGIVRSFHVEGIDHAGIVYHVSRYFAEHQINIKDLSSQLKFGAESGTALFIVEMHVEIPEETDQNMLEEGFNELADELHVDVTWTL